MATERTSGLTYEDLLDLFPEEDLRRRELIGGELIVPPAPSQRHQVVALAIGSELRAYSVGHGGRPIIAPFDVLLSERDVVQPDVMFFREEHLERLKEPFASGAPDLVVEVSSPSTRRLDLHRKRDLYQRFGVAEYWFVDLDSDRIEIYQLEGKRYGRPLVLGRGDTMESPLLPGFGMAVDDMLGPPQD